jgi:hypothetical protein
MYNILSILLLFGLGTSELLIVLIVMGILFVPYFIPSIIARKKVNFTGILLLNIFLGWTLLGWVIALIWAISDKTPEEIADAKNITVNVTGPQKKYKCAYCGFESYEKTTFCLVCSKDEKGMTLEDYKNKL